MGDRTFRRIICNIIMLHPLILWLPGCVASPTVHKMYPGSLLSANQIGVIEVGYGGTEVVAVDGSPVKAVTRDIIQVLPGHHVLTVSLRGGNAFFIGGSSTQVYRGLPSSKEVDVDAGGTYEVSGTPFITQNRWVISFTKINRATPKN
jgi:hypothetical protein